MGSSASRARRMPEQQGYPLSTFQHLPGVADSDCIRITKSAGAMQSDVATSVRRSPGRTAWRLHGQDRQGQSGRYDLAVPLEFRLMLGFDVFRSYRDLLASAKAAEDLGFAAVFRGDHLLSVDGNHDRSVTEAWTSLAGLARETSRVKLGTLVSPATFRHPAVLARMVATVDEMSDGRAEVGLGAGWYEPEHENFGIPLPPWPQRFDLLEEQLAIVRGLLTQDSVQSEGRHYRVHGGIGTTSAGRHPPILVGGNGKPRTLALAARFADEFNLDQIEDLAACRRAYEGLAVELDRVGRTRDAVVRSNVVAWPGDDLGRASARFAELEATGAQRLYLKRPATVPLSDLVAFARRFVAP
jgi:F420-dependent oxidoreductase-like protein